LPRTSRLDAELVRRGLSPSREQARRAIEAGRVLVRGLPAGRAATLVSPDDPILIDAPEEGFVSRGGHKLDHALARLDVPVTGRRWLDAGASTGGFTDRLLQGGASAVVAVDVGYGQLDWGLRTDDRVVVIERTNVRHLTRDDLPWAPDGIVADLSFISLELVLPSLVSVASPEADYVLLVKPQFEVGKESVGKGGVVRDPSLWRAALQRVVETGGRLELGVAGATPSEPPGPAGNREFFVHMRRGAMEGDDAIRAAIQEVSP
jgi:23S rRNA (cytidine1920-2'-O)/16S rRNA (cytidine1409-2'-O)-methyltransferase